MALSQTAISQLYVAIFNRASEGEGNTFWQTFSSTDSAAEVATAMLATSDAQEYFGDSLDTNQAFIEAIYLNTLNKTPADDQEGIDYWVGRLEAGESRGQIVSELVSVVEDYADSTDPATIRAYNQFTNRVEVSNYTAENLQEAPADYATSLNFAADLTVTDDDATVASAQASVDAIVNPEEPATGLTAALNDLQAANSAKEAFLEEVDATETQIATAVQTADSNVATFQYDTDEDPTVTSTAPVYATSDSVAVKAAKVSDAQDQLALNLSEAQDALATAEEAVAEVTGLAGAIDLYNSREETLEAAEKDQAAAVAAQAGAKASYDTLNSSSITINADGTVSGVIVLDDGELVLATNVTDETNPGVSSLLTAVQARVAADAAVAEAQEAVENAVINIGYLDFTSGDKDAIGAAFVPPVAAGADSDELSQADIQAELNTLLGEGESEVAAAGDANVLTFNETTELFEGSAITTPDASVAGSALAYNDLYTAIDNFETSVTSQTAGEYDFSTAPLTSDQVTAQGYVETAETAIEDLAELLSDLADAQAVADTLETLNDDIEAAEAAFEDLGVETPVDLNGNVIGTAEDDLFLAGSADASLFNFGAQGEDQIFFGADYSLVQIPEGDAITDNVGDVAALEVLWQQDGNDLVLYFEQEAFGGNSAGTSEIATITLTGVDAADVSFADGFLSAGTAA